MLPLPPYDNELALQLMKLCNESYKELNVIQYNLSQYGYKNVTFFENSSSQAFGTTKDNNVYIVFRGTQYDDFEWKDIRASFRFSKYTLTKNLYVHKGYYQYYLKIQRQIHEYVKLHKDKNLIITGYSLGGAMALNFSYEYPNSLTYVFATPRAVSKSFVNVKRNIYSVIADNDILSEIPLGINGYIHWGKNRIIKNDGTVVKNKNIAKLLAYGISILPFFIPIALFNFKSLAAHYFLKQHSRPNYIERLENAL